MYLESRASRALVTLSVSLAGVVVLAACESSKPSPPVPETDSKVEAAREEGPSAPAREEEASPSMDASSQGEDSGDFGHRVTLSLGELRSKGAEGLEPAPNPAPDNAPEPVAEEEELQQQLFARVVGGDNFFCGALKAGPIRCWGALDETKIGAFVDVALTGGVACGLTSGGERKCFNLPGAALQPWSTLQHLTRVAAAGGNFCALSRGGKVACWDTEGQASLVPPDGLSAKFIAVGSGFACAADQERKLICWGDTDGLSLPSDAPQVKDLAAGDRFVCAIASSDEITCWGQAPAPPPQQKYKAISAQGATLCAISTSDKATCRGALESEWKEDVQRVFVGTRSACAMVRSGELSCQGSDDKKQLDVPRMPKGAAPSLGKQVSSEVFAAFKKGFPSAPLPLKLNRGASFSFGSRLDARFDELMGGNAGNYRSGVRLGLPGDALAVTVLDIEAGRVELRTYSPAGKPMKVQVVAFEESEKSDIEEREDGTGTQTRTALSVESTVSSEGELETVRTQGKEVIDYVKEHVDGSRPTSKIQCQISATHSTDEIQSSGGFKRKHARVVPVRSTVDKNGCGGDWPGSN